MELLERKTKFSYSRSLKLGPAIGDWTVLQYKDPALDDLQVSQIQNVNFDSVTKDVLKQLHFIHYKLAEKMADKLSKDTDLKVELHTVVASQMTYEDFLSMQHDRIVQANYLLQNFGSVNVVFSWALADKIVNRLTGGMGEESESDVFSGVEAVVLQALMDDLVEPFSSVWGGVFSQTDVRTTFNTGQFLFDQKVSMREAYVTFTVYLYFGNGDLKHITWAYPSTVIRKLYRAKLAMQQDFAPAIYLKPETLRASTVDVTATLGRAQLTMKELKSLQPGDVIPLDTSFNQFVDVRIGSNITLKAQPGTKKDRVCLQIFLEDTNTALQPVVLKPEQVQQPITKHEPVMPVQGNPVSVSEPVEHSFVSELGADSHDDLGAAIHGLDDNEDAFTDFNDSFEIPSEVQGGTRLESDTPDLQLDDSDVDLDDEDFDWDDFEDGEDL